MAEQLSAEAQAMVDEAMRLGHLYFYGRGSSIGESERALRAHLERMAAMAAPQPVAREPLSEERIEAIMDEHYSPDISPADWCRATARAIERETAQGEQP